MRRLRGRHDLEAQSHGLATACLRPIKPRLLDLAHTPRSLRIASSNNNRDVAGYPTSCIRTRQISSWRFSRTPTTTRTRAPSRQNSGSLTGMTRCALTPTRLASIALTSRASAGSGEAQRKRRPKLLGPASGRPARRVSASRLSSRLRTRSSSSRAITRSSSPTSISPMDWSLSLGESLPPGPSSRPSSARDAPPSSSSCARISTTGSWPGRS